MLQIFGLSPHERLGANTSTGALSRDCRDCYGEPVPTPIGHALAGLSLFWVASAITRRPRPLTAPRSAGAHPTGAPAGAALVTLAACALLAAVPDLDVLVGGHRTVTHSLISALAVGLVVAIAARVRGSDGVRAGVLAGLVWGSHAALDWLGRDLSMPQGIMVLWPFSDTWHTSRWDVFAEVSRRYWLPREFILGNLATLAREVVILGPVTVAAWWWARRHRAGR